MTTAETRFTPGPWSFEPCGCMEGCEAYRIAKPFNTGGLFTEPDARLIAAAPRLAQLAGSILFVAENASPRVAYAMRGLVDDAKAALALVDGPSFYPADLSSDEMAEKANNGP